MNRQIGIGKIARIPRTMPIEFGCPQCLHPQKVDENKVGQHVYCPVCYFKLTVPAESTNKPIDEAQLYSFDTKPWDMQGGQELISFPCDICNTNIGVRKEQVGEEIVCAECGKKIIVPKSIAEQAKVRLQDKLDRAVALMTPKETYSLHDGITVPTHEGPKPFRFFCRLCGTALFATEEQIGTAVPCPDCEAKTTVPSQKIASKPLPLPPSAFEGTTAYKLAAPSKIGAKEPSAGAPQENLVPVVCGFCGTRMHATEIQIGQSKTCPDCGQATEIKAVSKPRKTTTATTRADAYGLVNSGETAPRPVAAFITSLSRSIVRKRQNDKESFRSLNRPPLPKRPLTERFFVPFAYFETWLYLLSFAAVMPLGLMVIFLVTILDGSGIATFTFGLAVFAVFAAAFCYFATFLLHVYTLTSSGMDEGEFKGEIAPADYFVNGLWLFTFSFVATLPGFLFGKLFVLEGLLLLVMMRLSHWFFFPISFLSSMEMGSLFAVLAKNTLASLFRQPFAWFRFYLLTGILFILADLSFMGMLWLDSDGSMFFITLSFFSFLFVIQSFFFFRLLGRLAWLIEETDRRKRELEEELAEYDE